MKQIIRRAFAAHIHGGGIISAPDKLVGEIVNRLHRAKSSQQTQRIELWCVNDEFYYPTKAAAIKTMDQGDSLSRVWYEWTDSKALICNLLNHNPVLTDEKVVIKNYQGGKA